LVRIALRAKRFGYGRENFFTDWKRQVAGMKDQAASLGLAGFGSHPATERSQAQFFDWRVASIALSVAVAYYAGAKIGFALTFQPHPVSVLWPPNAILLAALLLTPVRIWWVVLLAAFPAHLATQVQSNVPPTMIFCWFVSNSCDALIGAGSIRYLIGGPVKLDRLRNVAIFCLCGVFLAPFLTSFLDSGFVAMNHFGEGSYWEIWRIRFSSGVLAALTITPLIVTWGTKGIAGWRNISRWRLLEGACLLLGLCVASFSLFSKMATEAEAALLYAPLPFLLWAAVRFGTRGAATAITAVAFLAILGAAGGHGPFAEKSSEQNALFVQLFLIFRSLPLLFVAAIIEERDKVMETLREREERIGLAAESANLALWTIDFERRESWMSDKGRELFGFAANEPLSREVFLSRVHPEDREAVDGAIERARAGSKSFEIEYRLLRPDGATRWLISRGRYVRNDRGGVRELMGVAIDITAQVQADLQMRLQREEMTRMSRVSSMGELAASLAHELNQPLTAIASNAAAGTRFLAQGSSEAKVFQELLADVAADARRAGAIIHGIHHFVRKGEGIRRPVNLNEIVQEVLRLLHSDLLGRETAVETELAPNLPFVDANPVHLQQVLLNLLMNSLEAMHSIPAGKRRILISTRCEGNSAALVSVRDYGGGLPQEDLDKVFTQFYSTKPNGMGMGLTIVRSIVEAHGGKLSAENTGEGARFFFTLPVMRKSETREVA
jgi:two-component system, LuxR family, sensor kinase FixL